MLSAVTICLNWQTIRKCTLKVHVILVALLAIAPSPHLPQVGDISEADAVPTKLQHNYVTNFGKAVSHCRSMQNNQRKTETHVQGRPQSKAC